MRLFAAPRTPRSPSRPTGFLSRRNKRSAPHDRRSGRYNATLLEQWQYQPGSRGRVLRNLLGITSVANMNTVERHQLVRAVRWSFASCGRHQRFTAADICEFHRAWLGTVYSWAGEYRQVNLTRHFANLMIWQAGRLPVDFDPIASERKMAYFGSIRAALVGDYVPLQSLFADLIGPSASRRAPSE